MIQSLKRSVIIQFLLVGLILFCNNIFSQVDYDKYFTSKSLRIDYCHAGNANTETIYLGQIREEPFWGGSKKNLIDTFDLGTYNFLVYDALSNELIYSRGFCTLFQEWQTTSEADSTDRSFNETVICPYPKSSIRIEIHSRDIKNSFVKIFEYYIDPTDYFIKKEPVVKYPVSKIVDSGISEKKVDLAFIAEGYTKDEMEKFRNDVKKCAEFLLNTAPFDKQKDNFNIWAIESVSEESGTDIPGENIWKRTAVNSNFYTFDSERYLTTSDMWSVRNIAANVPYDQIVILVNTEKYGGGGIFNYCSICSSDNSYSLIVLVHEFGHAFAGLADEYYTSQVSYDEFYNLDAEPWEPNITTMVAFDRKWKDMIGKGTPVPTPAEEKYDSTVGVYEGGGYVAKGVYRPYTNCIMNGLDAKGFCPVCCRAITRMIGFYCE